MSAMQNVITVAVTTCLLAWTADADDTETLRFYYYTGCAPITSKVELWESPSGSTFVNKDALSDMIELSLRRQGVLAANEDSPYVLYLRIVSYTDVVEFTLRFMKPMKDLTSDASYFATTYLRTFAIIPMAALQDLYIETRMRKQLDPFIEAYMQVNRAAC